MLIIAFIVIASLASDPGQKVFIVGQLTDQLFLAITMLQDVHRLHQTSAKWRVLYSSIELLRATGSTVTDLLKAVHHVAQHQLGGLALAVRRPVNCLHG